MEVAGFQKPSGYFWRREKYLTPLGIQNPYITVRSLVTKPITLSRLLNNQLLELINDGQEFEPR
jgi:Flp pilus assembly CpaF family ATPase